MKEFSTSLKEERIKIDGTEYIIGELTYGARSAYLRSMGNTMEVRLVNAGDRDAKGNEKMRREIIVKDLAGAHAELLCGCMFRAKDDGTRGPAVTRQQVNQWGAALVEQLAQLASDVNGLEQPDAVLEQEATKN